MATPNITEICQNEALSQVLSDWGNFTYDQIIEALYKDNDSVLEHDDFHVWYALEDFDNTALAEFIESLTRGFHLVAQQAIKLSQEKK